MTRDRERILAPLVGGLVHAKHAVALVGAPAAMRESDLETRGDVITTPTTVLLIRHGEKPMDINDSHLSQEGLARAAMLAIQIPRLYPALSSLFATAESKHSVRPIETVTPLAIAITLPVSQSLADEQYQDLALALLDGGYAGQTVLVCWHHGKLPELARMLGAQDAPTTWDGSDFDHIWQLDYAVDGTVRFSDLLQPPVTQPED